MELKACFLVLIIFFQTRQSQSKKILCLLGMETETAVKWNKILLNELSAKGNDLSVVTPVLWKTESNIEFIHLENGLKFMKRHSETDGDVLNVLQQSIFMTISNWYGQQMASCRGNLNSSGKSQVLNMALNEKHSFDMIIFDVTYGAGCLLHFAEFFPNIPIVGITSSTLNSKVLTINQNSILNAAFDPFVLSDFGRVMNYWTRIYNTVLYGFDYIYYHWVFKPILEGLWSHYMQDKEVFANKTLNDLKQRIKVILANHHPTLHTLASLPYNVIPVPGLHLKTYHTSNTDLATDLFNFKEHFVKGIVLINLELEQLGKFHVQSILDAVRKLSEFGFIWKAEKSVNLIKNKPKNLILETKLENQKIFEIFKVDKSIKYVLTIADILSIQECLFYGLPIITLATTPEQAYLAQRIKEQGVAVNLQLSDLAKLNSILESTLTNITLTTNTALQLQKSFASQQNRSLDTAVWWVEHLLANPEANDYLYCRREESFGFFAKTSLDIVLFFEVLLVLCVINTILVCQQTVKNFRKFSKAQKKSGERKESKIKKSKKENQSKKIR